ncbi:MAG: hypothetical protein J6B87_03565 [Clostridia bacterium]|nr:hypothetical protein [Clostridia bacterium]
MINKILLLCIFISCLFLTSKLDVLIKANKYKKRSIYFQKTKESFLKHFISKFNFIKTKESFLSKQGNPFKLNSLKYYILKICLATIMFFGGLANYNSIFYAMFFAGIGYFIIDIFILIIKKKRDTEICNDILNVTDSINLQLSAHMLMKDVLKKQHENCKNKDFKKAMIIFSARYELSELNINAAIDDLENKFDILELKMFCNALKEYNKMGSINEILENLSETLKEKKVEILRANTKEKVLYITFGVIVALTNIILLTMYPLFVSVGQGFNSIFK